MRNLFNIFVGTLNLIIALWLSHWSLSFWGRLRAGRNGVTQGMVMLISVMALDRFRVAAQFLARLKSGENYLFEQALRVFNLGLIIASLFNLYQEIEKDG